MARDFRVELSKQLGFLERSCLSFDAGHYDEAMRIAAVLRILFHQTRSSTSLLSHLGAANIRLLSTSLDIAAKLRDPWLAGSTLRMFNGMGLYSPGTSQPYRPKLGDVYSRRLIPEAEWWGEIVFALDAKTLLVRKDIALNAANKDGGAHVDAKLTPEYERLTSSHDLGSWKLESGELVPISGHHYVALRQMGYEVLHSSELTDLAGSEE